MALFWLAFALATTAGTVVALLLGRRVVLVLPLAAASIAGAVWWISAADPNDDWAELGRAIWALFVVGGWLLGLLATGVYLLAQRRARSLRSS